MDVMQSFLHSRHPFQVTSKTEEGLLLAQEGVRLCYQVGQVQVDGA
jgi:hypothetical protein